MTLLNIILSILSILLLILGAIVVLLTLIFIVAGGANSTPARSRILTIIMYTLLGTLALGAAGTITLLAFGRPGWSFAPSALPTAFCIGLFIWMYATEF